MSCITDSIFSYQEDCTSQRFQNRVGLGESWTLQYESSIGYMAGRYLCCYFTLKPRFVPFHHANDSPFSHWFSFTASTYSIGLYICRNVSDYLNGISVKISSVTMGVQTSNRHGFTNNGTYITMIHVDETHLLHRAILLRLINVCYFNYLNRGHCCRLLSAGASLLTNVHKISYIKNN